MTEDENKKKKRNKKKKNNKQTNNLNSVGETSSNVSVTVDDQVKPTSSSLTQNHDQLQNDAETDQLGLVEAERQQWVQKEAVLEGVIRELKTANELHLRKEASYEEAMKDLRKENDSLLQKEASLNETIRGVQNDKTAHLQREATLEETIRELRTSNEIYLQKEAGMEMKLKQFQSEKNSWLEKETSLEGKIMHLEKEKDSWILKEASLEDKIMHLEKEKESWILKENTNSERIAVLNDHIARLEAQVLELEESKRVNLQESQLKEKISAMQLHIENLERSISSAPSIDEFTKLASERENLNSMIDAAQELIERLMTENAELVEKMNDLYMEPHHRSGVSHVPPETLSVADAPPESSEYSGEKMDSLEVLINDERTDGDNVDREHSVAAPNLSESRKSGEVVQIPLDDIEVGGPELQTSTKDEKPAVQEDEKPAVPFVDAPLTGAPFRLISYFTRYVSGADLVEKSSSNSRQ